MCSPFSVYATQDLVIKYCTAFYFKLPKKILKSFSNEKKNFSNFLFNCNWSPYKASKEAKPPSSNAPALSDVKE